MSREFGQMLTCTRCVKQKFLKLLREDTVDGGHTKYSIYEDYPKEWLNTTQMGDLCDECAFKFKTWINEFMSGHVCLGWKLQEVPNET